VVRARGRLAHHFQNLLQRGEFSLRLVTELPWLLQQLGDIPALRACLTHASVFAALCTELALGNYDLLHYWQAVGDSASQVPESGTNVFCLSAAELRLGLASSRGCAADCWDLHGSFG
jgi:hypothetical protein